jgi:hypothetical protein
MKQLLLITLSFFALQAKAQSTLNATGGSADLGGNTYSYSVGEMCAVHTASTTSLIVTHGVLQPNTDKSVGIEETWLSTDKINVYPNPTSTKISLELITKDVADVDFVLQDVQGRALDTQQGQLAVGQNKFEFDLSELANAYYLLRVQLTKSNTTYSKSFKIQKIK